MSDYVEEYRSALPKVELSYADFLYDHHRAVLLRQWSEIHQTHERFGCPLDPAEDGSWAPCVLHGMRKGDGELGRDQFLGSFVEPRGI